MCKSESIMTYDPQHVKIVSTKSVLDLFMPGDADAWFDSFKKIRELHQADDYLLSLRESIQLEGMRDPIVLGSDGCVWDGHHRLSIATGALALSKVPIIFSDFVSYTQEKRTL